MENQANNLHWILLDEKQQNAATADATTSLQKRVSEMVKSIGKLNIETINSNTIKAFGFKYYTISNGRS